MVRDKVRIGKKTAGEKETKRREEQRRVEEKTQGTEAISEYQSIRRSNMILASWPLVTFCNSPSLKLLSVSLQSI